MHGIVVFVFFLSIFVQCSGKCLKKEVTLSIIHFNDFHARYDEVSKSSSTCKPEVGECHGGFARLYTAINNIRRSRVNPIVINAGDDFQGTPYYNLFKWNITQRFMNLLPITAQTLGNHEFDDKVAGLVPYLKALKAPVLVSNINDTFHPEMQGLYKKSTVITIGGKRIGLVGVIASNTKSLTSSQNLIFLNEVESVNKEADRLVREQKVFTVIVISHSGYEIDKIIAKRSTKKISLIVGGHSHTLLYSGNPPDGSSPRGAYPTVVYRKSDGKRVLVVQASAFTRYLGDIIVNYDNGGEVVRYRGKPLFLGSDIKKDSNIERLLEPYKEEVFNSAKIIMGETKVFLDSDCDGGECNFGDFLADAMAFCYKSQAMPGCNTYVSLGILNPGSIRASLDIGNITYNDLLTVLPFQNTIDYGVFKGEDIKKIMEVSVSPVISSSWNSSTNLLQVTGFKIDIDLKRPIGDRIVSIKVLDECSNQYADIIADKDYRVAMITFLGNGGDGFEIIPETFQEYHKGVLDTDCAMRYVTSKSPITIQTGDRLTFVD